MLGREERLQDLMKPFPGGGGRGIDTSDEVNGIDITITLQEVQLEMDLGGHDDSKTKKKRGGGGWFGVGVGVVGFGVEKTKNERKRKEKGSHRGMVAWRLRFAFQLLTHTWMFSERGGAIKKRKFSKTNHLG